MNVITALILGILIGWVIEWVIDWIYWRRRQRVLAEKLADVEADASNLRADNTSLNNSVAALEANAAQFGRVKGELDRKITSLETEVSGLEAERNGLQAKIVDLESQTSGEGSAGVPGVAAVAAAAGATRLFDTGVETGEEPGAGAAVIVFLHNNRLPGLPGRNTGHVSAGPTQHQRCQRQHTFRKPEFVPEICCIQKPCPSRL